MLNKTFVVRSSKLPEEYKILDWKEVDLYDCNSHPEVPCVMVISRVVYSLVIPFQISHTGNLKDFLSDRRFTESVRKPADDEAQTVYYVEEQSKSKREKMRNSMQRFFNCYN